MLFMCTYSQVHVDTKSASSMFEVLRKKLNHTPAYSHFMSLLQHCLLLPLDYGSHPQHWLLFDRVVQQIVLQAGGASGGEDPDVAIVSDLDVKELVRLLAKEEELSESKTRAEELEKENLELANNLAKKEQELDVKTQEKEDLDSNLERTKEKLETETARHAETKQRLAEIEGKLAKKTPQKCKNICQCLAGTKSLTTQKFVSKSSSYRQIGSRRKPETLRIQAIRASRV